MVATKGVNQVGKVTSAERGATVTLICAMNATGSYLPPMLIFPRKRMIDALMQGAPPQSAGYCSDNGWTDSELFFRWLEHFVSMTNASVNVPHIIILDGHHSRKTLAAVEFARNHGITLITLPPHCTHKMQPLDRTYCKAFKSAYSVAADNWMVSNPGRRICFYDMAALVGKAFMRSSTPEKAVAGFRVCGLWPFDDGVFTDDDFLASMVTDEAYLQPAPPAAGLPPLAAGPAPLPAAGPAPLPAAEPAPLPAAGPTPLSAAGPAPPAAGLPPLAAGPTPLPAAGGYDVRNIIQQLSSLPKISRPRARSRVAECATILTSSPHKQKLEMQKAQKERVRIPKKKTCLANRVKVPTSAAKKRKAKSDADDVDDDDDDDDDDDEWPCIVCMEPFKNSRSREVWVECQLCKKWANEECTPGEPFFNCHNCDSESD